MKQRIIETIRAVPVAGKTYEEYVEALAEELQHSEFEIRNSKLRVDEMILEEIENGIDERLKVCMVVINKARETDTPLTAYIRGTIDAYSSVKFRLAEFKKKYTGTPSMTDSKGDAK